MKAPKQRKEPRQIDVDEHAELYSAKFDLIKSRETLQQVLFEKEELTKELLEKREQLRNYKGLVTERNDLLAEIQALQLQLQQSNEYANTLSNENLKLHHQIQVLQSKVDASSLGGQTQSQQLQNLEEKLKKKAEKYHKLKTQQKLDQHQLELHKNKLSSLTLDNDASNLKTELLIEEITALKLELAEKDNSYIQMKRDTEQNLIKAQSAISTHQLLMNENELLQKQNAEIRRDKQMIDQEAIKLRVELESARNKISEMSLREEANNQTIADERQKYNDQNAKLTKYISASRELRSMLQDKEQLIGDLRAQISEQDGALRQRRDEISRLKSSLADAYTAKTELDQVKQKMNELSLQNDAQRQKNDILQQSLDSQMQMNKNLSNEVNAARRQAADLSAKNDNLKFEMAKSASTYDTSIKTLQDQNSKLTNQLDAAKKEITTQSADYESKMLGQAAEYESKLKEQHDKFTEAANNAEQQYTARIQDLERRTQMQSRSLGDTFKKVSDLTNEINELNKFKENIINAVPQSSNGKLDVFGEIKSLIDQKNAACDQLKTVNKEMKSARNKYEQFMRDTLKMPLSSSPPTSQSLAKDITTALSAAADNIQQMQSKVDDLQNKVEKKQTVLSSLQGIIGNIAEDKIPEAVSTKLSQIQGENAKLNHIMNQAKSFVNFDTVENLPVALANEKAEQMQLKHTISDKENEAKRYRDEVIKQKKANEMLENQKKEIISQNQQLQAQKDDIQQQMNMLQHQVSAILPSATSFSALPQAVTSLNNELEKEKKQKELFLRDVCKVLNSDDPSEKGIIEGIKILNTKLADAEERNNTVNAALGALSTGDQKAIVQQITQLQSKERSLENLKGELLKIDPKATPESAPRIIKELKDQLAKEKTQRANLVTQLGSVLGAKDEESLPVALNKLVNELNSNVSKHTNFVDTLGVIVKTSEENDIPTAVKKVTEDYSNEKNRHMQFIGQLSGVLNVNSLDDNTITGAVQSIVQELAKEREKSAELLRRHDNFVEALRKITNSDDEASVHPAVAQMKNTIDQTQELINSIIAIVTHKPKSEVNFILPLSPQVTATITAALNDLVRKYDALRNDADIVIKEGIELGYTGNSVSECSRFIADQEVTRKAQEMHEDTFTKLKQVREENAKERELLEKRNSEANKKLAELRQQKIEQNEDAINRMGELKAEIEDLQKQLRKASNDVEFAQRLRFELVRLAAKEVYDIGTLKAGLTESEIRRLQL